ncbi:hypothetical protein FQA39_LY16345 [Lamprigera yunnana]|nr:hypothetical protein FQA39_LY16345 [Lamprigera yunnana]
MMAAIRKATDLTVKELKAELKKRKMGCSGNKETLVTKLKQELNSSVFNNCDIPKIINNCKDIVNKNSRRYKYINSIQNQIKMLTNKVFQLKYLVSKLTKWISQSNKRFEKQETQQPIASKYNEVSYPRERTITVTQDFQNSIRGFNENDYVIILGGSNNVNFPISKCIDNV